MQEKIKHIEANGVKYPLVFNLNVMEKIQDKYETIENWGDLTEEKTKEDGTKQEVNLKALKYGILEMINEGIDIENESREDKREFITDKQVGRIITGLGLEKMAKSISVILKEKYNVKENKIIIHNPVGIGEIIDV